MPCFYLTPKQDDFNKIPELQICIAEALYDVDSIVADPGAYTKEELATLHSQIVSNRERTWEIAGGSEQFLQLRCQAAVGIHHTSSEASFHLEPAQLAKQEQTNEFRARS